MKRISEWIRESLLREVRIGEQGIPSLNELRNTEWSYEFEQMMRNRLIQGRFRYGKFGVKSSHDRIKMLHERLSMYERERNPEYLVDIANFSMIEFAERKK